jgi:cytochrome c oxidase subunit 2
MQSKPFLRAVTALTTGLISTQALAADWTERSDINLRPGVTEISQEVHDLHTIILAICTAIGLLVFGLILWSAIRHRRSRRAKPADFHENVYLEVLWTVIPFIILVAMAIPATKVLIEMEDTASESDLIVKVTGHRWNWSYEYLQYQDEKQLGVSFFSRLATPEEAYQNPVLASGLFPYGTASENANQPDPEKKPNYMLETDQPLVIPADQKVRFLVTSADVIHSFYVPDFGIKKDAIPGLVNETWTRVPASQTGTYYGQCAELCGKGHAFMPIEIDVRPKGEFETWLAQKQKEAAAAPDLTPFADVDEAMELGETAYNQNCAVCHSKDGTGGTGPSFVGSDLATNPDRIDEHIDILLNGQNAMPSFKAQLTPREIAAVITYERNAWGNDTGDLIQPEDVQ